MQKVGSESRLARGASQPSMGPAATEASRTEVSWDSEQGHHSADAFAFSEGDMKDLPAHMVEQQGENRGLLKALEQEENEMIRALRHAYNLQKRCRIPNTSKESERFQLYIEEQDFVELNNEVRRHRGLKQWFFFDSFFGLLVLINGVLFGLATNGDIDEDTTWVFLVQSGFIVAFAIEWCIRWCYHPKGLNGMLKDAWTLFDLIVLIISVLDVWLLRLILPDEGQTNIKVIQVTRVVRLLRLIRLIRLLKLLQDLWVLVRGMSKVAEIFVWAVLSLIMIIYSFALLMTALYGKAIEDQSVKHLWGTVTRSMLTLAEFSTFSGAYDIFHVELDAEGFQRGVARAGYCLVLLAFLSMSTFGITNLIVGVMLTATVSVEVQSIRFGDSFHRLTRHEVLLQLRTALLEECQNSGLSTTLGSPHVSKSHLLKLLEKPHLVTKEEDAHPNIELLTSISNVFGTGGPVRSMFELAGIGEDEIEGIFAELEGIVGPMTSISVDDFIESCLTLTGYVHQIDVHTMLCGFNALQDRLRHMTNCLKDAEMSLQKTSNTISQHLEQYHTSSNGFLTPREQKSKPNQKGGLNKTTKANAAPTGFDEDAFGRQAERLIVESENEQKVQAVYTRFDFIFCILIFANAILVAYEVGNLELLHDIGEITQVFQSQAALWFVGEIIFLCIFGTELILRLLLHYQITTRGDTTMYWKIFPRIIWVKNPIQLAGSCWKTLPTMLRDPGYVLEIVIWVASALDVLVLTWILSGNRDFSRWFMPVKVARLIRLFRMSRLITLVPELRIIISGVWLSGPVLFWCLVSLTVTCYVFAVIMVVTIDQSVDRIEGRSDWEPREVQAIKDDWGNLGSSMLILFQLCTFSDWGSHMEVVRRLWWAPIVLGVFMIFAGFSMLNMVTGVMVRSTFRAIATNLKLREEKVLLETRQALLLTRDVLADARAPQDQKKARKKGRLGPKGRGGYFKETFAKMTGREQKGGADNEQTEKNMQAMSNTISVQELNDMLINKRFSQQLIRSEIRADEVITIYSRLRSFCGQVTIRDFIDGLMRLKTPVASTDIAAAKSILRRSVGEVRALCGDASQCQDYLMEMMGRLHKAHFYQSHDVPDSEAMLQEEMEAQDVMQRRVTVMMQQNQRLRRQVDRLKRYLASRPKSHLSHHRHHTHHSSRPHSYHSQSEDSADSSDGRED
mmetsp:Transcript_57411/g.136450  ORF Transcript_57411/g.136450 Transcript_57411/m.136450 type:complete len:1185 (-) Transcript_57411:240-3794(-)